MSAHEQQDRLKNAVAAIQSLRAQLDEARRGAGDPIAVIGIGCRFPGGANDPESFWHLLRDGVDAISEVPRDRWDVDAHYDSDPEAKGKASTRWGGFVEGIDLFDAQFFGISPREASTMDPQQRMLLETAWEALEHAGAATPALAGSDTGVFLGINNNEYYQESVGGIDPALIDGYSISGGVHSVAAGRLAYILGLNGPAMAIDTACSSSLVALALACQSLRAGDCRMAIAVGANAMLSPQLTIGLSRLRMLSPDGRCKTFDAAADGFVQGEGCGVIVLKRLADAIADGDRILAVLRGWAVNQDGRSAGLTAPNGPAQEAVIRRALERAGVAAADIDYVEAHGTGTALGDPIEMRALARTLTQDRAISQPLRAGSVKTNIGHLGAAAGIAGVIKTILALDAEVLPPLLHLRAVNPHIDIEGLPIELVRATTPWPRNGRPRLAGVSSFGFSGTNAHVILEEAPAVGAPQLDDGSTQTMTLSAKSAAALEALRRSYADALRSGRFTLRDFAHTTSHGRMTFAHRITVAATTCDEAAAAIESAESIVVADLPAHAQTSASVDRNGGRTVSIPTYPFQRQHYWLDRARDASLTGTRIETALGDVVSESVLRAGSPSWLADHRVAGQTVVAGSHYLALLLELTGDRAIEDVSFAEPLIVNDGETTLQAICARDGSARIFSRRSGANAWTLHCSARIAPRGAGSRMDVDAIRADCTEERSGAWWYREIESSGIDIGATFRGIQSMRIGDGAVLARIVAPAAIDGRVASIHPALLDACLQTSGPTFHASGSCDSYLPVGIDAIELYEKPGAAFWCHAMRREDGAADITLIGDDGEALGMIRGFRVTRVRRGVQQHARRDLYRLAWQAVPDRLAWQAVPASTRAAVPARLHLAGEDDPLSESLKLLRVAQEMIAEETPVRLVVAIDDGRIEHAPLRGLVSAIAAEYPGLRPFCIAGGNAADELLAGDGEEQVAYRDGVRHALRLVRHEIVHREWSIDAEATVLVTGGLRGAGLAAAEWLAALGARRLVLMARRAPDAEAARILGAIAARGTEVIVHLGDVAREDDVRAAVALCGDTFRGVIHSAGVLEDAVLEHQTQETFARVFAAKVDGTLHLDRLTRGHPLDFFVLFSSLAAFIGAAGQANYAAANAFMDGVAKRRREEGLRATTVHWGPWSGTGMAADRGDTVAKRLANLGIGSLTPRDACELLGAILAADVSHTAVIPSFDVNRFAAHFPSGRAPRLLDALRSSDAAVPVQERRTVLRFRGVSDHERDDATRAFVRRSLAHIAGMHDGDSLRDEQSLADFGFDSLMAVELKNRVELEVGITLPVARFLAARNAAEVAASIVEQLEADEIDREVLTL
jgi:acyl transferase domain-containing protein/acyl carrier protein